jgi:electron transport complex protein RnfC
VTVGQVIARPGRSAELGALLHAPVNATVGTIVTVDTPYRDGIPGLELHSTSDPPAPPADHAANLPRYDAGQLFSAIHAAGIVLDDFSPAWCSELDWLIVNGLESEPEKTVELRSLTDHVTDTLVTTSWLKDTLGARRACIVVDARRRRLIARLRRGARGLPLRVVVLANKYPQSFARLVVYSVTGREVPAQRSAGEAGAWVVDVTTALEIRQAVLAGRRQTARVITVAGDAVARPGNYRIPLGITVGAVAEEVGVTGVAAVVADNLLSGPGVRHTAAVLTKRTQMLLFARPGDSDSRSPMGCIRCGWCQDHCPVGIDPRALLNLVESAAADRFAHMARRFPTACVDCGVCDYVCPSSLPLMRAVQRSRRDVLEIGQQS